MEILIPKPPQKDLYDLLYFEREFDLTNEVENKLKKEFPTAKQEDASDCIHGKRTGINVPGSNPGRGIIKF